MKVTLNTFNPFVKGTKTKSINRLSGKIQNSVDTVQLSTQKANTKTQKTSIKDTLSGLLFLAQLGVMIAATAVVFAVGAKKAEKADKIKG